MTSMRWSLKSLLFITALVCLALALAGKIFGTLILLVIGLSLGFVLPFGAWWRIIVGALLCHFVANGIVAICLFDRVSQQKPLDHEHWMYWIRFANQFGALIGGALGWLRYKGRQQELVGQERVGRQ